MSRSGFGRFGLILVSLLSLFALFSASALAVGKPKEVNAGPFPTTYGVNSVEVGGGANPNGASTTITLEYRDSSASEFKPLASEEIGSGTAYVQMRRLLGGIKPLGTYQLRTQATNEYGSVYSPVYYTETPYWLIEKASPYTHIASFATTGTATFTWRMGTVDVKIACNQSGSGTFGGEYGTGTGSTIKFSNCAVYQNEAFICKATAGPSPINFDQAYLTSTSSIGFVFPEGCFYGEMTMTGSEQFSIVMPKFNVWPGQTSQAMTLTKKFKWTGYTVTATISTSMSLTGEDLGKKFAALRQE